MTFSSLISGTLPHHNKFSSRYGAKVTRGINHHWAGVSGGDARLLNPNEAASANYILYSDGRLFGQVPEEYRAWTSGSPEADNSSITIEIQNSGRAVNNNDNDPNSWPISPRAMNTLIALWADVGRRYGWGKIDRSRIRGHREFASTACPGGYVWHRLTWIAEQADAILNPKAPKEPETEEEEIIMEGLYYREGNTRFVKIFDSRSGFEFNTQTNDPDSSVSGTNRLAAAWGIKSFWLTDKGGYDAMSESLRAVRLNK